MKVVLVILAILLGACGLLALLRFAEVALFAHHYSLIQLMMGVLFVGLALLCMKALRNAKARKEVGKQP